MAKVMVVAIRDRALDSFSRPFFVPTIGAAIRSFADEVNRADKENPLYAHPEDFDLYKLGEFDEQSGSFTNEARPGQIAIGKDLHT